LGLAQLTPRIDSRVHFFADKTSCERLSIVARLLATLLLAVAPASVCLGRDDQAKPRMVTVRVRVEWSVPEPQISTVRLEIAPGRFDRAQSLGSAADDAGTIQIKGGMLSVRRRSPRTGDGFDVSVTAPADADIEFELKGERGDDSALKFQMPLAECFKKTRTETAQADQVRAVIRRAPGDALAVNIDRSHLVFGPEELFRATIVLNFLEPRDTHEKRVKASLKWKLVPAGHTRAVADGSASVSALVNATKPSQFPLELRLPRDEGVYDLRLSATGRGFPDSERVVQLAVVESKRASEISEQLETPQLVDSFEPEAAGMFRKVSLDSPRQRLGHSLSRMLKFTRRTNERGNEADEEELSVTAYRLHVSHPGRPHFVELTLSSDIDKSRAICVLEKDAQGQFMPAGLGGMVAGATFPSEAPGESRVYRQMFWPPDREPAVLVASPRAARPVEISRVEVYEWPEHSAANRPTRRLGVEPQRNFPPRAARLVGQYLHTPGFARPFDGPRVFDSSERHLVDDWQTFFLAGRRLTEFLRNRQHTALMLAVLAEGATIYPSTLIEPSLRFDNGRAASSGQDPVPKDALELLFRLFDREGLALVPELQFDAPLAAIERLRGKHDELPAGLALIDGDGRTCDQAPCNGPGAAPHYNALDPRVQQAVFDVLSELLERYSSHPSLAGVAFQLSPNSFLQLPGNHWGYDSDTIRRFEQATRMQVPHGPAAAHHFLTTTARREWQRFRCGEIARFHRKLAEVVVAANPEARVVFSGHLAPLGATDFEAAAVEIVRTGGGPAQALLAQGLDFSQPAYAADRRVTVLRPLIQNNAADLLDQAALATLNSSPAIDALYRTGSSGGLLSMTPGGLDAGRIESLPAGGSAQRFPGLQLAPDADVQAQQFAHLLATLDAQTIFDANWMITMGADDPARRIATTIAKLPNMPFRLSGPQIQPVVVRAAQRDNATWLYAVNDSSLAAMVVLVLDCPATTTCRVIGNAQAIPLSAVAGNTSRLEVELAGHSLFACRLDQPGVEVLDTQLALSEGLLAGVQSRIDRLSARMNAVAGLSRGTPTALTNPGFEHAASGATELPGWDLPVRNASWSLDDENPRSGQRSLVLSAEGIHPLLASPELFLDGSRFVRMSLWLRSSKPQSRVKIMFDAKIDAQAFHREEVVEVGKNWKKYVFRVDSMPAGAMQDARLHVQPVDRCKLWIDDVEVDGQAFSGDEIRQLTKTLSSVKLAWEEARYADCQRLLDGYWGQLLLSQPAAAPTISNPRPRLTDRMKGVFRR